MTTIPSCVILFVVYIYKSLTRLAWSVPSLYPHSYRSFNNFSVNVVTSSKILDKLPPWFYTLLSNLLRFDFLYILSCTLVFPLLVWFRFYLCFLSEKKDENRRMLVSRKPWSWKLGMIYTLEWAWQWGGGAASEKNVVGNPPLTPNPTKALGLQYY